MQYNVCIYDKSTYDKVGFFLSRKLCMGSFKIVQEERSRLSTFLICGKSLLLKYLTYHFWFTYSLHGCHRSVLNRDEGQRKGQKEKAVTFDDNYLKSNYLTYSLVGIRPQDPQLRRLQCATAIRFGSVFYKAAITACRSVAVSALLHQQEKAAALLVPEFHLESIIYFLSCDFVHFLCFIISPLPVSSQVADTP